MGEKEAKVEMDGEVMEALRGRMFRIQLDNGHETLGYLAGRLKRYRIRVMLGDRVRIELSPYDLSAAGSCTGMADWSRNRMRGTMLWFNEDEGPRRLRTDEGDRFEVPGAAFDFGEKPVGRCAGRPIEFDSFAGAVTRVAFVPEPNPRRARLRNRR